MIVSEKELSPNQIICNFRLIALHGSIFLPSSLKSPLEEGSEVSEQLRKVDALAEDLSSAPSFYILDHNCL